VRHLCPWGPCGKEHTWEGAAQLMLDTLAGDEVWGTSFDHASTAALVLAQCYLEPAAPRHLEGQQQPALVSTDQGAVVLHTGVICMKWNQSSTCCFSAQHTLTCAYYMVYQDRHMQPCSQVTVQTRQHALYERLCAGVCRVQLLLM
jgi:hypothetical protein